MEQFRIDTLSELKALEAVAEFCHTMDGLGEPGTECTMVLLERIRFANSLNLFNFAASISLTMNHSVTRVVTGMETECGMGMLPKNMFVGEIVIRDRK